MLEAYTVAATYELIDRISEPLMRINALISDTADMSARLNETFKLMARGNRFGAMARQINVVTDSVARLGDAMAAVGDSMAGVTAGLSAEMAAAAASAREIATSLRSVRAATTGTVAATAAGEGGGHGGGILHGYTPIPGTPIHARFGVGPKLAGVGALLGGLYFGARLQEYATQVLMTAGVSSPAQERALLPIIENRIMQAAQASRVSVGTAGEAAVNVSRYMTGFPLAQRMAVLTQALRFGQLEHVMKGINPAEAAGELIGMIHQTGTYSAAGIKKLADQLLSISLMTPQNIKQLTATSSYFMGLFRQMGIKPIAGLETMALLQRSGLSRTKSGTWLAALMMGAMPGSAVFTKHLAQVQIPGLYTLGLINQKGQPTFYTGGEFDLNKFVHIGTAHLLAIPPAQRLAVLKQAFGSVRAARAGAQLFTPQIASQVGAVMTAINTQMTGATMQARMFALSPVQKSLQAIVDGQIVLIKATQALEPVLNSILGALNSFLGAVIKLEQHHPTTTGFLAKIGAGVAARWAMKWLGPRILASVGLGQFVPGLDIGMDAALLGYTGYEGYRYMTGGDVHHHHGDIHVHGSPDPETTARHVKKALTHGLYGATHGQGTPISPVFLGGGL